MDLGPAGTADSLLSTQPEATWIEPIPDGRVLPEHGDPAELAESRETLRLAFVAALQHLPASQRAVLILREVLRWKAAEVAELLDTSVASVNGTLQRARAGLATSNLSPSDPAPLMQDDQQELLHRYVNAFEAFDIDALVTLLHEDATMSMPPFELWLQGSAEVGRFLLGTGSGCRGSRLVALTANGSPAFGQYRSTGPGGGYVPWALQVLDIKAGRITALNSFLDTERMFPLFGLPASPPELAASPSHGGTPARPQKSSSSCSSREERRSRTQHPCRRAVSCSSASACTATMSVASARTSLTTTPTPLSSTSRRSLSHSSATSARVIEPMTKTPVPASVCDRNGVRFLSPSEIKDGRRTRNSSACSQRGDVRRGAAAATSRG